MCIQWVSETLSRDEIMSSSVEENSVSPVAINESRKRKLSFGSEASQQGIQVPKKKRKIDKSAQNVSSVKGSNKDAEPPRSAITPKLPINKKIETTWDRGTVNESNNKKSESSRASTSTKIPVDKEVSDEDSFLNKWVKITKDGVVNNGAIGVVTSKGINGYYCIQEHNTGEILKARKGNLEVMDEADIPKSKKLNIPSSNPSKKHIDKDTDKVPASKDASNKSGDKDMDKVPASKDASNKSGASIPKELKLLLPSEGFGAFGE
jgi:hypothetical protein